MASETEEVLLESRQLRKSFQDVEVLKGVDFKLHRGEVKAILGPSGSGKSTFLRCLALLESYEGGEVLLENELVGRDAEGKYLHQRDLAIQRRNLGMVFQKFNLFPHLTVLENVLVAPKTLRSFNRAELREKAFRELEYVGMAGFVDRYPSELSGGQQQRVAIARAIILNPKVLFFDEPTSALDPELVGEVLKVIERLAEEGMTMVVVTHEVGFARKAANSVVMFDNGVIVEEASPLQFFDAPANQRTKNFLTHVL